MGSRATALENLKKARAKTRRGIKSASTLEKEKVLAGLKQRIMHNADLIFDSQLSLARGQQFLYKIEKEWIATGKGTNKGFWKPKKPELVESAEEIRAYLEQRVEEGEMEDDNDSGATYYYITVKEPVNQAIDSMFDRTFGKSTSNIDVTSGGKPIPILGNSRKKK